MNSEGVHHFVDSASHRQNTVVKLVTSSIENDKIVYNLGSLNYLPLDKVAT